MSASMYEAGVQLDYTPTVDTAAGTVINLGVGLTGVPANDIAANQLGSLSTAGVYKIPTDGATAYVAGVLVDYRPSDEALATGAAVAGDFAAGRVVYPVAETDTFAYVLLNDRSC